MIEAINRLTEGIVQSMISYSELIETVFKSFGYGFGFGLTAGLLIGHTLNGSNGSVDKSINRQNGTQKRGQTKGRLKRRLEGQKRGQIQRQEDIEVGSGRAEDGCILSTLSQPKPNLVWHELRFWTKLWLIYLNVLFYRNCYQNYLDYHRCLKVKNDEPYCHYYKWAYIQLCPKSWVCPQKIVFLIDFNVFPLLSCPIAWEMGHSEGKRYISGPYMSPMTDPTIAVLLFETDLHFLLI